MNIDLLIKLVKLANNNPNENEANLAARKVCKLIEESKFNFSGQNNHQQQNQQKQSTRPPNWKTPYYNPFDEWFKDMYNEKAKSYEQYQSTGDWYKNPPPSDAKARYNEPIRPSQQQDKRNLKCKTCGHTKSTSFVGLPEVFECNNCQWTAYLRNKK